MRQLRRERVGRGVGSGQPSVSRWLPCGRRIGDRAKVGSVPGQERLLGRSAMAVLVRVVESKAAGRWRAGGWQGNQSGECGQSLWEADAIGSGAGTHRGIGAAVSLDCYERGRAPAKGDLVIDQGNESMVGDGHAMGVVA